MLAFFKRSKTPQVPVAELQQRASEFDESGEQLSLAEHHSLLSDIQKAGLSPKNLLGPERAHQLYLAAHRFEQRCWLYAGGKQELPNPLFDCRDWSKDLALIQARCAKETDLQVQGRVFRKRNENREIHTEFHTAASRLGYIRRKSHREIKPFLSRLGVPDRQQDFERCAKWIIALWRDESVEGHPFFHSSNLLLHSQKRIQNDRKQECLLVHYQYGKDAVVQGFALFAKAPVAFKYLRASRISQRGGPGESLPGCIARIVYSDFPEQLSLNDLQSSIVFPALPEKVKNRFGLDKATARLYRDWQEVLCHACFEHLSAITAKPIGFSYFKHSDRQVEARVASQRMLMRKIAARHGIELGKLQIRGYRD